MKTQNNMKSGLIGAAMGIVFLMNGPAAYGITETLDLLPSTDFDIAINQELGWLHTPVPGTILSAFLTITGAGVENLSGGDEYGWVRMASIFDTDNYQTIGIIEPGTGGIAAIDLSVFPNYSNFISQGLFITVFVDPDGNNPDAAFRLLSSVLVVDVEVTRSVTTHATPDAGSTLLLLGAGLTALGTLKRRMS